MRMLKVVAFGDEVAIILPPDMVEYLGVKPGDEIEAEWVEAPAELETGRQLIIAKRLLLKRREMLQRLAD